MDKGSERRKYFKAPPVDPRQSQEARRTQALEEQKRRRAQQLDASRQLDQFSGLNLDDSDDEVEDDDDTFDKPSKLLGGVGQFTTLLQPNDAEPPPDSRSPSPLIGHEEGNEKSKKKGKRKGKGKGKGNKIPSKWTNKCMYAELLEMREDAFWTESFDIGGAPPRDGLPDDLVTAWVGLAPIPVGKRCLAVTMQSPGVSGVVPNTILRSRLLGKVIIRPFPSPLPSNTILDCILDENWRSNGMLHVLDVIRWKSQDVAGCEANFRFWWRDTRLTEITTWPLPAPHKSSFTKADDSSPAKYKFPYPTTFVPVPYTTPLSFENILGELLGRARQGNSVRLKLPIISDFSAAQGGIVAEGDAGGDMEIDVSSKQSSTSRLWAADRTQEVDVSISSDGLLLYVGEAAYESGESPLSVWVPRVSYDGRMHDEARRDGSSISEHERGNESRVGTEESPLDTFERLVRRRLIARRDSATTAGGRMIDNSNSNIGTTEVEMDA